MLQSSTVEFEFPFPVTPVVAPVQSWPAAPPKSRSPRLSEVSRKFLAFKDQRVKEGELHPKTYQDYKEACEAAVSVLGRDTRVEDIKPMDFARLRSVLAERTGPKRMGKHILSTKTMFRWAYDADMIERSVRYGQFFKPPCRATIRKLRGDGQWRLFEADEIRRLLAEASPRVKAFILMGINCAYGPQDCASLPAQAADEAAQSGVLTFPRPKTGIERQAVLWPETREALALRSEQRTFDTPEIAARLAECEDLAFHTSHGHPFVRNHVTRDKKGRIVSVCRVDMVGDNFRKLLKKTGVPQRGFYGLRHTFRTVADEVGDAHAAGRVMGHEIPGMNAVYVNRITKKRLYEVSLHVRNWLFSD